MVGTKMTDKKKEILDKVFALFLKKGYNAVSITDIQKEVGLGRASLYHYFKSKEELLKEVVSIVFVDFAKLGSIEGFGNLSLKEYLIKRNKKSFEILEYLEKMTGTRISIFNFYLLFFNAFELFPEYLSDIVYNYMKNQELVEWKTVIRNSIAKNEVKPDTNVEIISRMFVAIEDGIGLAQIIDFDKKEISMDLIKNSQQYLLSLISL
jgi:AcrR family transcriptional regulator